MLTAAAKAGSKRMFDRVWREQGGLTLTVVRPMAQWSLPAGYAYQEEEDLIRDNSGNVVTNYAALWTTTTVNYIPAALSEMTQTLIVTGMLQPETREVFVWDAAIATVKGCFRVSASSQEYRVNRVTNTPQAWWGRVVLERQK